MNPSLSRQGGVAWSFVLPARASAAKVRLAAFGTLSNGSDVRLLASPSDDSLSIEAKGVIETFFYSSWKGVAQQSSGSYFAFLQLDSRDWGLIRIDQLGRATTGDVIVAWIALIDVEQLDAIQWATHRLFATAFPSPTYLPPPNTRLDPYVAAVSEDRTEALEVYNEAFDRIAFQFWNNRGEFDRNSGQIAIDAPTEGGAAPLTPEGALFGVWDRLGKWRADISYCTWSGIQDFMDKTLLLRLLIGRASIDSISADAVRIGATRDGDDLEPPSVAWNQIRQLQTGITSAESHRERTEHDVAAMGTNLWRTMEDATRHGDFNEWTLLAELCTAAEQGIQADKNFSLIRPALPNVLEIALKELEPRLGAALIEHYISGLFPVLLPTLDDPNPTHRIAKLAIEADLVHRLSTSAILALAPVLFDMAEGEHDLLDSLVNRLKAQRPEAVNWSGFLTAMRAPRATDEERRTHVVEALVVGASRSPTHVNDALEQIAQIIDAGGIRAGLRMVGGAPPADRPGLFQAVSRSRRSGLPIKGRQPNRLKWATARRELFELLSSGEKLAATTGGSRHGF